MKIKPMTREAYEKLLKFGNQGSFMLWEKEKPEDEKAGLSDMRLFKDPNLVSRLKEGAVFVAINLSKGVERKDGYKGPWWNFHSEVGNNTDVKLRHAFEGTPFEGCYITDLVKDHPESDSSVVQTLVKANPQIAVNNIKTLREELECFNEKPVIVAMGGFVRDQLKEHLGNEYEIVDIYHYSYRFKGYKEKAKYREHILDFIKTLNIE